MKTLPQKYDTAATEKRWQEHWLKEQTYRWEENLPRDETFVIDTPPPTVSGHLHMGHVFSYTQADFVARWQRMNGKTVFYPMGFDDNGLPTERLVEKAKKKTASRYESREEFIKDCMEVSDESRKAYRELFQSTALSVDWNQEYHTVSEESRKMSQLSFLDLFHKGDVTRKLEPMLWDPVDQTAIAQAEVEDKELPSHFCDIKFKIDHSPLVGESNPDKDLVGGNSDASKSPPTESANASSTPPQGGSEYLIIATTRPEMIPACVGVFYHPDDERYQHLKGKQAITPLFGVKVPILEDDSVEIDKGTGIMMCCTFGDEADIEKWRKHDLPLRQIVNKYGKLSFKAYFTGRDYHLPNQELADLTDSEDGKHTHLSDIKASFSDLVIGYLPYEDITLYGFEKVSLKIKNTANPKQCFNNMRALSKLTVKKARAKIIEMLEESGDLVKSEPITHAVKCAERSGAPLEILPTPQWFVSVMDKKAELKAKSAECNWHPEWMAKRMDQWIDGLSWDWCISRQRYFGVPFPVWYVEFSKIEKEMGNEIIATPDELPINPLTTPPKGYKLKEVKNGLLHCEKNGEYVVLKPDIDVMDTWATSSISPQLNSKGITPELAIDAERHTKLYPADLRPQAHEIIRTWAFYTIVKSHLHGDSIPWQNLMISGWCLAEDKTKMSKSKGNVVTPIDLIEEHGSDVVRYWASTSKLGQDTAFSRDLLKIGKKLVNKLWNATKFAAIHLEKLPENYSPSGGVQSDDGGLDGGQTLSSNTPTASANASSAPPEGERINATLDKWIISRLHHAAAKATAEFEQYEYASALRAIEDFFWNDFCDNYLELVKKRAYDEAGEDTDGQMSAVYTIYHCLDGILRLFAPIVPHVTEELWSHIFEEKYAATDSIHARGNWVKASDYPLDEAAEAEGIAVVELLEAVRKAKSEKGVSIKWPITTATISAELSDSAKADLMGAGNIAAITHGTGDIKTESEKFSLSLEFAEESDAA